MKCQNCGAELPDDSQFCNKCGAKVILEEKIEESQTEQQYLSDNVFTDDENGFIMNRFERIKTLSYSFVVLTDNAAAVMEYLDFQNLTDKTAAITVKKNAAACLF